MITIADFQEPIGRDFDEDHPDELRLRWNDGYSLMLLSGSRIEPKIIKLHPRDELQADLQDLVIYGESDREHTDLLGWWTKRVQTRDMVVAIDGKTPRTPLWVRLRQPSSREGAAPERIDDVAAAASHEVLRHLDRFFAAAMSGNHDALTELRAAVTAVSSGRLHLLIRDFEAMRQGVSETSALLASFRDGEVMRQDSTPSSLVIVITAAFEMPFLARLGESGYLRKCREFRMPAFTAKDLEVLASRYRYWPQSVESRPLGLTKEDCEETVDGTGGQPELVRDALLTWKERGFTPIALRSALKALRESPPSYTRRWSENLRKLVAPSTKSEIARRMREYVQGETTSIDAESRISPEDRALYCCGWLGLRDSTLAIRSPVHRTLARRILSELR